MKILSPAGNFECLKAAIFNGANEVYLGINEFNARNNIDGFSLETLKEAVDFAHIFDVKVNLAINILFSNEELQKALDVIVDAYNLGVDSFIIQDLGLAKLVFNNYPEIEIHASTQMGLHNLEGVQEVLKYGFKRIVLARETPLEEIKRIKDNCNVEIEYFAQGALCVSFSGNCYLSSYLHNASGNRGRCKQLCRLPYTFEKNGKVLNKGFLLSAKDFNMINRLKELKNACVDVLKIEGRARRPFYVATATKEYFNALNGKKINEENLKLGFNRTYTAGYLDGNDKIISNFNNHIGIFVGKVEKVNCGKNFNEVFFSSCRPLFSKSTFKIFSDGTEKTTLTAYDLKEISKGKYKLTTTQKLLAGDVVNLIVDSRQEEDVLSKINKKEIEIKVFAKENKPITAKFSLSDKTYEVLGPICMSAKSQPLTVEEVKNNFSKSELFSAKITAEIENVFIQKKQLNEFRRDVFSKTYEKITEKCRKNAKKIKISTNYFVNKFSNFQIVEKISQNFEKENIIFSPEKYDIFEIIKFKEKCLKENKKPFLDTPNFALSQDIKLLKEIINKTKLAIIANNYYALSFKTEVVAGAGLNVYNNVSAIALNLPIITAESNISERINFPYMTLRHCPFKANLNATCKNCPYSEGYSYKMENGKILEIKRKKLSTCTFYLTN